MMIEMLEKRQHLSVTVSEGYPGFYELEGDSSADTVTISVSQAEETFTLNGTTYTGVAYLYINTYGGNDTITLTSEDGPGAIGASVTAGEGDDSITMNFDGAIWAEGGNDTLSLTDSFRGEAYGGAGDDHIYISGYCIDAAISGGDGNDFIDCSANLTGVMANGGAGNDTIYGSVYGDQLDGGDGYDVLVGNGGQDEFYSGEVIS